MQKSNYIIFSVFVSNPKVTTLIELKDRCPKSAEAPTHIEDWRCARFFPLFLQGRKCGFEFSVAQVILLVEACRIGIGFL